MKVRQSVMALFGAIALLALVASTIVGAHPMNYQGTVISAGPAKLAIKTIDEKTKKESTVTFTIDRNTKVKRGDRLVSYADAKIVANERIVVIVDMDAATKMVAEEIRLGAS